MTINIPFLYQGEDKVIEFTLKNSAGVVINLATLTNIVVYLVDSSGTVIAQYSREVLVGFNTTDFKTVDAVNGRFDINLKRAITLTACKGIMYFEIKISETDADFVTNKYFSIAQENIFDVQSSNSGRVTI